MRPEPYDPAIVEKMRQEWDERARENARHYVATSRSEWSDEAFFHSGQVEIDDIVLNNIDEICAGRAAGEMRALEIGCGAGRMTQSLGRIFGRVDAVDISSEMIGQARSALSRHDNIQFHVNNGVDLSMFEDDSFDFALSAIVFQHIPSKAIVENYIRETARVLRRHSLFKFQVQGCPIPEHLTNTWVGVGFSEAEIAECARRYGFQIEKSHGAGTQYYWITFLKP
jgi:SAM-dependent methyltransferase